MEIIPNLPMRIIVFMVEILTFLLSMIWLLRNPGPANNLEGSLIGGGSVLIFLNSFMILSAPSWLKYDQAISNDQLILTGLSMVTMTLGYNFLILGFVLLFHGRKSEKTSSE